MGIEFFGTHAAFSAVVSVDDAEALLEWLQHNPQATADFSLCTHMHCANLQVLMAAGTSICQWPADPAFRSWLESVLPKLAGYADAPESERGEQ